MDNSDSLNEKRERLVILQKPDGLLQKIRAPSVVLLLCFFFKITVRWRGRKTTTTARSFKGRIAFKMDPNN